MEHSETPTSSPSAADLPDGGGAAPEPIGELRMNKLLDGYAARRAARAQAEAATAQELLAANPYAANVHLPVVDFIEGQPVEVEEQPESLTPEMVRPMVQRLKQAYADSPLAEPELVEEPLSVKEAEQIVVSHYIAQQRLAMPQPGPGATRKATSKERRKMRQTMQKSLKESGSILAGRGHAKHVAFELVRVMTK